MAYGVFVDAANRGRGHWIVLRDELRKFLETAGVRLDVGTVLQAFLQDHVRQAVQQYQVGSGRDR